MPGTQPPTPQPSTPQPSIAVWDDEQPTDHAGEPVAPLTPAGLPYRWRLRLRGRSLYAVDADQVLAAVIDDLRHIVRVRGREREGRAG